MVTQVRYSVTGWSTGRVTPCTVCTWHVETWSVGFLVEPQNEGRRFGNGLTSKLFCAVCARSSFVANCPRAWSFSHRIFSRNFPCHGLGLRFFRLRFRIFAFCMGARRLIVFAAAVSFGQATRHATTAASEAYAAAPALQSCLESSDSPARFRLVVISVVVSTVISAGSFSACVCCSFSRFLSDLVSSCGACLLPPAGVCTSNHHGFVTLVSAAGFFISLLGFGLRCYVKALA
jgi:hypothetical protein